MKNQRFKDLRALVDLCDYIDRETRIAQANGWSNPVLQQEERELSSGVRTFADTYAEGNVEYVWSLVTGSDY